MQDIVSLYNQSRHTEVIALFNSPENINKSDPLFCQYAAASYFRLAQYEEAYEVLSDIYSMQLSNVSYLSLYAATCRHLGKYNEANKIFQEALKIDENDICLKNNYTNLLIDLGRLSEAKEILTNILLTNPDYEDARANLHRLESQLSLSNPISSSANDKMISKKLPDASNDAPHNFYDPLLFAFSKEEVERTAPFRPTSGLNSKSISDLKSKLPIPKSSQIASDQMKLVYQAISDNNAEFALKLCTQAYSVVADKSQLFSCVGDAYVSLKNYKQAEIAYLHSIALGSKNFKNYFNLVSICMLKKDLLLAEYYLMKASYIDSSNPNIKKIAQSINNLKKTGCSFYEFSHD